MRPRGRHAPALSRRGTFCDRWRTRALAEETDKENLERDDDDKKKQSLLAKSLQRGEPCAFDKEAIVHEESPAQAHLPGWRYDQSAYLKQILCARVYDVAEETDLQKADALSAKLKNSVFLKREDKQQVFSFKLRGAFNK